MRYTLSAFERTDLRNEVGQACPKQPFLQSGTAGRVKHATPLCGRR